MQIEQINTPWLTCGLIDVSSVERDGSSVVCCGYLDQEIIIYIEWEDEIYARDFEDEVESNRASIQVDEDDDGETTDTHGITKMLTLIDMAVHAYGFKGKNEVKKWLSDRHLPVNEMFLDCF
jgi:hypothetical protein